LVSNRGLDIALEEFESHFTEKHVERSTSLQAIVNGRGAYLTGPLARYSLNFDKLPSVAKEAARAAGLGKTCNNPFKSIIVRAVETVFACDEALRLIKEYEKPAKPAIELTPREGTGCGCTEAPRGICFHRYRVNGDGIILDARIVPPTSQNQLSIEEDLRQFVQKNLNLPDDKLTWKCEQAVRNYDPCISCSCHSLKLVIDRT
jgi:sulfhydrogenase subunit alpha